MEVEEQPEVARTTLYQVVTNGYDKPLKPKVCKHIDHLIVGGATLIEEGAIWNRCIKIRDYPKRNEYAVYMDGNMSVKMHPCMFHGWVETVMEKADLAICKHPHRKCAYVEIEACLGRKKITAEQAKEAHEILNTSRLPKNFGLWECGIIIRRTGVAWVEELERRWFSWIENSGIHRDQLWLPMAIHQKPETIPAGRFKTLDMDVRSNPIFSFGVHNK
jgi:hypothetical protein